MADPPKLYTDPNPYGSITEATVDEDYDRYIKNLEEPKSSLQDDEVMQDVIDSFIQSSQTGSQIPDQIVTLPTAENMLDLYKKLSIDFPVSPEQVLTTGSGSWYRDSNLLAPPMTYETFLKNRYGLDLVDIMGVPEPRPDPNAIRQTRDLISERRFGEMLPAPRPTEPTEVGLKPPINLGQTASGIASFLRKRLPLVQAARLGWSLLPEKTKAEAQDIFSSMNEPWDPWDPFGLELGLPERALGTGLRGSLGEENRNQLELLRWTYPWNLK